MNSNILKFTSSKRQSSLFKDSGSSNCALVARMAASNRPVKLCMYSVFAGRTKSGLKGKQKKYVRFSSFPTTRTDSTID